MRELLQLARARSWDPVVYRETVSGAARERPELDRLLADARAGRLTVVAVWALDRLSRQGAGPVLNLVGELDRCGVALVSVREPWLDTSGPFRDIIVAFAATMAKLERARLIERTKAGLARAARSGTRSGKPIGRPRASTILLSAAAEKVRERARTWPRSGNAIRAAAREAGVSEATLRRWMRQNPPAGILPGTPGKTPPETRRT